MYIFLYFILITIIYNTRWKSNFLLYLPLALSFELFLPLKDFLNYWPRVITFLFVYLLFYADKKWLYVSNKSIKFKYTGIYLFIFFLLISLTNTTDFALSINLVMNFIVCLLLYKLYSDYFKSINNPTEFLTRLLRVSFFAAALWPVYIGLCTYFRYGRNLEEYGTSFIYYGHTGFYTLFLWIYINTATIYFILKTANLKRYIGIAVFFTSIAILLFIAKRTYLYTLLSLISLSFFFYFLKTKKIGRFTSIVAIFTIITIYFILPIAGKYFLKIREVSLETSYFEEGRFLELVAYYDEIIKGGSLQDKLFGKEIFNSEGKFFGKTRIGFFKFIERDRILHSDYAHILYGTGIVGSISFILMMINIFYNANKRKHLVSNNEILIKALFTSLFIALIINGFSDGILYFSNRVIVFIFLGAFTGYLNNINLKYKSTPNY